MKTRLRVAAVLTAVAATVGTPAHAHAANPDPFVICAPDGCAAASVRGSVLWESNTMTATTANAEYLYVETTVVAYTGTSGSTIGSRTVRPGQRRTQTAQFPSSTSQVLVRFCLPPGPYPGGPCRSLTLTRAGVT